MLLIVILALLSMSLLAACGEATATTTPSANKVSPTPMSNEDLAKQLGAGTAASSTNVTSTTAAAGSTAISSTTVAGSTAISSTTVAGGSPAAASTPPALPTPVTPKPTPTGTAQTNMPGLVYPDTREVKLDDTTYKQLLDSFSNTEEDDIVGKFTPTKISIYLSQDSIDKIEPFFKKALEGDGWQQFSRNADSTNTRALLVYQKNGTKLAAQFGDLTSADGLPPEFGPLYKQGDRLIIVAEGTAYLPQPTPFAIPGTPTLAVGPGQKKIATIEMENGGKIVIELYPDVAPKTVENFEKLANKGFYNGLTFHRVEKDPQPFVVQGGDPKGDGTGNPGYSIPDEFTTQKNHIVGTIAMAHSALLNSGGSQFYITLAPAPQLDGKYAIFGQVIEGMDVVNNIKIGDKMKSVKVEVK
jgi:peptidyl-prolyl cis-trans isomerase B (cyclophilin B)